MSICAIAGTSFPVVNMIIIREEDIVFPVNCMIIMTLIILTKVYTEVHEIVIVYKYNKGEIIDSVYIKNLFNPERFWL